MRLGSSSWRLRATAIVGALAICVLTPAVAGARITVPPGATEGDQYFEQVPNGGGSGSPDRGGGSGGGQPVAATQALNALGADGRAAADLANSNRPLQQSGHPNQGANTQPSSSASTEGEGGMGIFLPILLVLTAVAAIAYGVRRRLTPA